MPSSSSLRRSSSTCWLTSVCCCISRKLSWRRRSRSCSRIRAFRRRAARSWPSIWRMFLSWLRLATTLRADAHAHAIAAAGQARPAALELVTKIALRTMASAAASQTARGRGFSGTKAQNAKMVRLERAIAAGPIQGRIAASSARQAIGRIPATAASGTARLRPYGPVIHRTARPTAMRGRSAGARFGTADGWTKHRTAVWAAMARNTRPARRRARRPSSLRRTARHLRSRRPAGCVSVARPGTDSSVKMGRVAHGSYRRPRGPLQSTCGPDAP